MPKSWPAFRFAACCLSVLVLSGCFGSEPDDSPYTVRRGEAFESLQLEIEPDGTPVLLLQVGMYMAHQNPDPDNPYDDGVSAHNFRSIILRRAAGGWSATGFKNIHSSDQDPFPTLIPDPEGRFHAFLSDGGQVKRYVFGNGGWNRAPGTNWLNEVQRWASGLMPWNWKRFPRIAVAGADLLLTLHNDWSGSNWVMEGTHRKVEISDSSQLIPIAFQAAKGYRVLAARYYNYNGRDAFSGNELRLYRWAEGTGKAERQSLGDLQLNGEPFFARFQGRLALFAPIATGYLAVSLDDSGWVADRDTLPLPKIPYVFTSFVAADTAGCLHGLIPQTDSGEATIRYGYWNTCESDAMDTLAVPKPDSAKSYWGGKVNLRITPDGTPVAAFIVRENPPVNDFNRTQVPTTILYWAEFREGRWRVEKVDERVHPDPARSADPSGGAG